MPHRNLSLYIPEYYLKYFDKLQVISISKERTLTRMVCRAVKDYVEDGNFDSISFKQYLLAHPEDKERIREMLDA